MKRIFVTGATGFVGSAIVRDLLDAGYHVIGLARSDASMASLAAIGAQPHRGDLEDLDSLKAGAALADGVFHTAFIHDWSNFQKSCDVEASALEAIGSSLVGSNRPFIVTSGTALVSPGRVATESAHSALTVEEFPRAIAGTVSTSLIERGVNLMTIRLSPSVHGDGDHGFVPILINLAREKGVSAYIGEGANRWTAVHRLDAGPLYRLAFERGTMGANYHAVDEEAIPFKEIATAIGKRLNVPVISKSPEEAAEHFGWFARFASIDCPASSKLTREQLGWKTAHPGLLQDLAQSTRYFEALTTA
jgi:nucleoside-diphosphate-sugar epimerase